MSPDSMIEEFERQGAAHIRLRIMANQLPGGWTEPAIKWLADQDRAERSRNEASQSEQMRAALSANHAAKIAAIAAIIAIPLAIISIAVTVLAWVYPHKS